MIWPAAALSWIMSLVTIDSCRWWFIIENPGYAATLRDGITNLSCILFVHRYRYKFPLSFELSIRNWLVNLKIANVAIGHFLNCGINISQTGFLLVTVSTALLVLLRLGVSARGSRCSLVISSSDMMAVVVRGEERVKRADLGTGSSDEVYFF